MTHPEALSRIAELQKQLDELKASLEKKDDGLWYPSGHESYYFVRSCGNIGGTYFEVVDDRRRLECENIFKTQEQAERHAKRLRLYNKLWRLAEHLNGERVPDCSDRWFIVIDIYGFRPATFATYYDFAVPIFKSEELAQRAISMLTDEEKEIFKNIYRP